MWFVYILIIGLIAKLISWGMKRATIYFSPDPVGDEEFERYHFEARGHGVEQGTGQIDSAEDEEIISGPRQVQQSQN